MVFLERYRPKDWFLLLIYHMFRSSEFSSWIVLNICQILCANHNIFPLGLLSTLRHKMHRVFIGPKLSDLNYLWPFMAYQELLRSPDITDVQRISKMLNQSVQISNSILVYLKLYKTIIQKLPLTVAQKQKNHTI